MKRNKRGGSALVLVMISAVVLTILVGALYMLFESNIQTQRWTNEQIQARCTAEAGANLSIYMLMGGIDVPEGTDAVRILPDSSSSDEWFDLGGELGWVQAWVDPHDRNVEMSAAKAYEVRVLSKVVSEDQIISYGIGTMIMPKNFAVFSTFLNEGGGGSDFYYGDGYRFDGPVHTNTSINISSFSGGRDKDPWFYTLSMSDDEYYYYDGSSYTPTSAVQIGDLWIEPFEKMLMGEPYFTLGADTVAFGPSEVTWEAAYNAAASGGLLLSGLADGTRMILMDSTLLVLENELSAVVTYDLSSYTNPVVWIDNADNETVYLKGILTTSDTTGLSMSLTIGVNGTLAMSGSLRYRNRDLLDPDNDNMLGIIVKKGNFVIAEDPDNPGWTGSAEWGTPWTINTYNVADLEFDGIVMVLDGLLQLEDVEFANRDHWPSPRVALRFLGGIILNELGPLSYDFIYGYWHEVIYDPRLMTTHPPFYPQSGIWDTAYWEEKPFMTESDIGDNWQ